MNRAEKLRAVAQKAHDNGDCVCCMDDPDTVTITISRGDALVFANAVKYGAVPTAYRRLSEICGAVLEDES